MAGKTASEKFQTLSSLLVMAERGRRIFITRRGKRVALLTAPDDAAESPKPLSPDRIIAAFKFIRSQSRTGDDSLKALLGQIPAQIHDHQNELWQRRMLTLARRFNLSAHDAAYLELADRLQCPLRTNDQSLRVAAEHLGLPGV